MSFGMQYQTTQCVFNSPYDFLNNSQTACFVFIRKFENGKEGTVYKIWLQIRYASMRTSFTGYAKSLH